MNFLKKKLITYRTQTFARKKKSRPSPDFASAKKIGIIFTIVNQQKHEAVKRFIKKLEAEGKKVQVLAFLGKGKENYEFKFYYFTEKDINLWGRITSPVVSQFLKQEYDFLFHLDLRENLLAENVVSMTNSKCRVGSYLAHRSNLYDLMIKNKNKNISFQEFTDQMYQYTTAFTSQKDE
jgi:hypothetical protein